PPCARLIYHPWLRNKMGTRSPVARSAKSTTPRLAESFLCDDGESFHFPIKPYAVNDKRNGADKRCERAGEINRRAFNEIDPNAPGADAQREQRRKDYEDDMESFE